MHAYIFSGRPEGGRPEDVTRVGVERCIASPPLEEAVTLQVLWPTSSVPHVTSVATRVGPAHAAQRPRAATSPTAPTFDWRRVIFDRPHIAPSV